MSFPNFEILLKATIKDSIAKDNLLDFDTKEKPYKIMVQMDGSNGLKKINVISERTD